VRHAVNAIRLLALFVAAPAAGEVLLDCDFEDQPLDQIIGTGGAAAHQPVDISGVDPYVRTSPTGGQALEIIDTVAYGALSVCFTFLDDAEVTTGWLTISAVLHFVEFEDYVFYVREQLGATQEFLNLRFENGGTISQGDADDFGMFPVGTYTTGEDLLLEIVFDLAAGTCAVLLDGVAIVPAESHGVVGAGVGRLYFGFDHDSDLDGDYYLQSVLVNHEMTATAQRSYSAVKALWD
jgi:hypothetical protein